MVTLRARDMNTQEVLTSVEYEPFVSDAQIERVGQDMAETYPEAEIEVLYE